MQTILTQTSYRDAEAKLKTEQERHRHAKDELSKMKSALQFVKTQALVRLYSFVPFHSVTCSPRSFFLTRDALLTLFFLLFSNSTTKNAVKQK